MVNLNDLTIPYLKKLAKELNITLRSSDKKAEKIKTILKAGIPKPKLEVLYNKYLNEYKTSKGKKRSVKKKSISFPNKLEARINLLETQVKFMMSKIDSIEIQLAKGRVTGLIERDYSTSAIQNVIKSKVSPGDSVSIDEIISMNELQNYPMNVIEKAIINLIDDELFDGSEGHSTQKIKKNIGRLIRR